MDEETRKHVEEIERKLGEVDIQIRALQAEKQTILESDREYADYLDLYSVYYDDEPLNIRQYYERTAELERINAEFDACSNEEYEALWRKRKRRLAQLERMLAV